METCRPQALIPELLRRFAAVIAGSLIGLVFAALVCWVWLSTVDGHSLDW